MRRVLVVLVLALAVTLTAGPLLAAPVSLSAGVHLTPASTAPSTSPRAVVVWALGALGALGITIRKDAGAAATKFVQRAQAAAPDYKDGVQGAGGKWESGVAAAESSWEQGVQQAMTRKAYTSGASGQGGKYQTNAVTLGSQRYGQGILNAKDAYARGIAPVLSVLSSLSLPAKSFRGSPANQQRANAVATALAALRTGK